MRSENIYLTVVFLLWCSLMSAHKINVSVPSTVNAGENFRLVYTVNTQDVEDFRIGKLPTGLEVIAGPYTSQRQSFQMVNGHTSSNSSITYTYILYADKSGSYNIPAASAVIEGQKVHSQSTHVRVVGSASTQKGGAPKMHGDTESDDAEQMRGAGSHISASDLFIKVSASKKRVYEQEPILLTYKVYTRLKLTQLDGKMPDLTGFHTQEIPLPQQKSFHVETVNGQAYNCVTWSQYVMYPQMTGKLQIPSITFHGIIVQENRAVDPFEAFFNGGSGYIEVKRDVIAPSVSIQVDPLPKRPSNFSGGVGIFNLSATINHNEVKAGEPISLRVVVGGTGNLKLIKQPELQLPKDFDKYDPKVTDKTKLTQKGVEGNMLYDFLLVPHHQGEYTIPPVEFTYYDISSHNYRTLHTQEFKIKVTKGDGNASSVSDFSTDVNKDIHALKRGESINYRDKDYFFGGTRFWLCFIVPLMAFATLIFVFRNRAKANADVAGQRRGRANKVAAKRLKKASTLMFQGKREDFFDEILRALWGYVGDKLNIPVESLSRENVADNLKQHGVDEQTIAAFIESLNACEYERYAPGDDSNNMSKTFNTAMTAITDIESVMKHSRHHFASHSAILALVLCLMPIFVSARQASKTMADSLYNMGNYQQAISTYKQLLKRGEAADLYYNLGNAYYRTDNIPQAILAYERALRLAPGDDDIRHNLQFARSKTIDKITPESEMFFLTWFRSVVSFQSIDAWARTSVVAFLIALILLSCYLLASRMILRKIGFYAGVAALVSCIGSVFFAYEQKQMLSKNAAAVVTSPVVDIHKTPSSNSTIDFVIHEGTHVDITDVGISGWYGIRLQDGREGWLPMKSVERI